MGIAVFIVLLLFVIFFHELGHFLAARWSGIKITQFFIGFGPTIWSRRRGLTETVPADDPDQPPIERPETEYGVKLLPLGGFVKVLGMSPFEEVRPADESRSFQAATYWRRAAVLVAGSVTHFITAFIALMIIFTAVGLPDPDKERPVIDQISAEVNESRSPALVAGLKSGDRILAVDGRQIKDWDEVRDYVRANPGKRIEFTINRDQRPQNIVAVPAKTVDPRGRTIGLIGVLPQLGTTRLGPVRALRLAGSNLGQTVSEFVKLSPTIFNPRTLGIGTDDKSNRPISIVGAGRIASQLAGNGRVLLFLMFFVQLNMAIGLFNLLPLPPLDGGHLALLGIERLRGKALSQRALTGVMAAGFVLIMTLGLSLVFQDIVNPVTNPLQ